MPARRCLLPALVALSLLLHPASVQAGGPKAQRIVARKAIEAAMKADGLTDSWRDYSEMHDFLDKGYKDHPDYDGDLVWDGGKYVGGQWDSAAHDMLRSLERSMD